MNACVARSTQSLYMSARLFSPCSLHTVRPLAVHASRHILLTFKSVRGSVSQCKWALESSQHIRVRGVRTSAVNSKGHSPSSASPNWSDRPPVETDPLFPGCDYNHWLIVMDPPNAGNATKEEMIDHYVKTLARVLGSEEAAIKAIYNVSCERYYGFGCEIDENTSNKLVGLPGVQFVLPDSYVDPEYKDYGGELLVDGKIVPRTPERQRRVTPAPQRINSDRPRYNDRTRYVRRRESTVQGR